MSFPELMMAGVNLMLLGMGIVFSFLVLLVFVMGAMSRLALAIGEAPQSVRPVPAPAGDEDNVLVAVISAAVHRYRGSKKQ